MLFDLRLLDIVMENAQYYCVLREKAVSQIIYGHCFFHFTLISLFV